jgi:hypothetical protein
MLVFVKGWSMMIEIVAGRAGDVGCGVDGLEPPPPPPPLQPETRASNKNGNRLDGILLFTDAYAQFITRET